MATDPYPPPLIRTPEEVADLRRQAARVVRPYSSTVTVGDTYAHGLYDALRWVCGLPRSLPVTGKHLAEMLAARRPALELPAFEVPCPDCTGEIADAARSAMAEEWNRWQSEESAAYTRFIVAGGDYEGWKGSDAYRDLKAREPDDGQYCVECDGKGVRLTPAGEQILDHVRRWAR